MHILLVFLIFTACVFAEESVVSQQIKKLIVRADALASDVRRLQAKEDPDIREIAAIANRGADMSEEMFVINEQNPVVGIREKYLAQELKRKMDAIWDAIDKLSRQISKKENQKRHTQKPRRVLRAAFFFKFEMKTKI